MRDLKYITAAGDTIAATRPDGSTAILEPGPGPLGDLYQLAIIGALGAIAAYEPPPPPPWATVKAELQRGISAHIDGVARSRGYDDGVSCASYKGSTVQLWAAEASAFIAWRDNVWLAVLDGLADVEAGKKPAPVISDIITQLPQIVWPEAGE